MAFMTASDVKLANPLKPVLGGYAQKGQGSLAEALGRIGNQAKTSSAASGRIQGDYQPFALGQANTLASRNINDVLGGVLGGTSYNDAKAQQEFERQMSLAREIGDINSPSLAEEILGGLSGGVNLGAKGKGLYDALSQYRRAPSVSPQAYNYGGSERYA